MSSLDEAYIILLIISEFTLFVLLIIGIQQLCISDIFDEKPRLRRILLILLNLICFLCLNPLVYFSALHPHQKIFRSDLNVQSLYILVEALAAIIGFHTFGKMFIFIIDTIYKSTPIRSPKWFYFFMSAIEVIGIMSVIICHSLAIITNDTKWIFIFFIVFGALVFILDVAIIALLRTALKLYDGISGKFKEIQSAKCLIKMAMCMGVGIIICAIIDITFTVQEMTDFELFHFDFMLVSTIMHSVILIALGLAEILWIYKNKLCCVVPEDSMCDVWCNQLCFGQMQTSDDMQTPIIMQDSVNTLNITHTINTKDLMPTIMEPSLQSNQLSVVEDVRSVK